MRSIALSLLCFSMLACGSDDSDPKSSTGGTAAKPVGTVWLAWAAPGPRGDTVRVLRRRYEGDRDAVRRQAVADALGGLLGPDG